MLQVVTIIQKPLSNRTGCLRGRRQEENSRKGAALGCDAVMSGPAYMSRPLSWESIPDMDSYVLQNTGFHYLYENRSLLIFCDKHSDPTHLPERIWDNGFFEKCEPAVNSAAWCKGAQPVGRRREKHGQNTVS